MNAKGVKFSGCVAIKLEMLTAENPCIAIVFGKKLYIRTVLNFRQNGHELIKQKWGAEIARPDAPFHSPEALQHTDGAGLCLLGNPLHPFQWDASSP
ncbi:MAG: hypothetical protein IPO00_07425 [Betaproteobacteria bacterium]|nr:hypothetical protein [Betaproteobacteria bacterium]